MPKKLKLNLDDLKIQSFVTALTKEEKRRLEGASGDSGTQDTTKFLPCPCCTGTPCPTVGSSLQGCC